jgi:nucleoid-associated protein YgaU
MIKAVFATVFALLLVACDERDARREANEAGDKKARAGAAKDAIGEYESAFDGTAKSAEMHYKIALLYDEKLKSPLDAIHHYERYLELAGPEGKRLKEAKAAKADCEKRLQMKMEKEGFMSTGEAVRLRNENESLRKIIADLRNPKPPPPPKVADPNKPDEMPPGSQNYVVQKGDTLASIAIKFYKNRTYASHIKDANFNQLGGKDIIRPGQTLIIPEAPAKKKAGAKSQARAQ